MNHYFLREELIPALRSGNYRQAQGLLRRPDDLGDGDYAYCCLGVACDLSHIGTWKNEEYHTRDGTYSVAVLPTEVAQFLGWSDKGIPLEIDGVMYENLALANDDGCSFTQIADALETLLDRIAADAGWSGSATSQVKESTQ
jgi:hypothetical protein